MKRKSVFIIALALLSIFSLCSCTISVRSDSLVGSAIADAVSQVQSGQQNSTSVNNSTLPQTTQNTEETVQSEITDEGSPKQTESTQQDTTEIPTTKGFFTNAYGTPTTICAHRGCNMYIVSSGNSNCCRVHSSTCKECGIFINEGETLCQHCSADKSHL